MGILAIGASGATDGSAQTLQGRVLDDSDETPVATALVRLVDEAGELSGVGAADSTGFFRIVAPAPGVYRLRAERIGYEDVETPLLEAGRDDAVYPVDLLMRRAPIPIPGLEISAEQVDRRVRSIAGIDPRSLRWDPIRREDLVDHVERAHDLTGMLRWGNHAGIEVMETSEGPCYLVRRYGCMPVYLNGFELNPEIVDTVPLDMLQSVFVVSPTESILYPQGGVLMFTAAWLR